MDNLDFVNRVVGLTNLERSKFGLAPLSFDSQLNRSAQLHSVDMALNDYFAHDGLNGSTSRSRIRAAGYQDWTSGENIAAGQTTPEQVVQAWMNSPGHRANILNSNFQSIGIGYYFLAQDTGNFNYYHYWTQNFGTRVNGSTVMGIDSGERLSGSQGNDTIYGLGGEDIIVGNAGDDVLFGNMGEDIVYGNQGADTIYGGKDRDLLDGGDDNDVLFGNLGQDILYGNAGSDILYGGKEDDALYGELGNDILCGDLGFDTLTGGGGADRFVLMVSKGTDVIADFQAEIDLIGLSDGLTFANLTITQGTGINAANTLIASQGELLAVLTGIGANTITSADFLAM
jgi:serralysin